MDSSPQVLDPVEPRDIFSLATTSLLVWQALQCLLHSCSLALYESVLENSYLTTTGKEKNFKTKHKNTRKSQAQTHRSNLSGWLEPQSLDFHTSSLHESSSPHKDRQQPGGSWGWDPPAGTQLEPGNDGQPTASRIPLQTPGFVLWSPRKAISRS